MHKIIFNILDIKLLNVKLLNINQLNIKSHDNLNYPREAHTATLLCKTTIVAMKTAWCLRDTSTVSIVTLVAVNILTILIARPRIVARVRDAPRQTTLIWSLHKMEPGMDTYNGNYMSCKAVILRISSFKLNWCILNWIGVFWIQMIYFELKWCFFNVNDLFGIEVM